MNIEFPPYYKEAVELWLLSEGFMTSDKPKEVDRRELYLSPGFTRRHLVFALCRVADDKMVYALKVPRHKGDTKFVKRIFDTLCFKS